MSAQSRASEATGNSRTPKFTILRNSYYIIFCSCSLEVVLQVAWTMASSGGHIARGGWCVVSADSSCYKSSITRRERQWCLAYYSKCRLPGCPCSLLGVCLQVSLYIKTQNTAQISAQTVTQTQSADAAPGNQISELASRGGKRAQKTPNTTNILGSRIKESPIPPVESPRQVEYRSAIAFLIPIKSRKYDKKT